MTDGRAVSPNSEAEYELIEAAVMETERGRWFLREFARRNRHADTELLLAAIDRLFRAVAEGGTAAQVEADMEAQAPPPRAKADPFAAIDRLSTLEKLRLFT